MSKKVLLIGGGTGGHVFPLRNLVDELIKKGASVEIVVADQVLDRKIVKENFSDVSVSFLKTGKIRRYISWKNFIDIFHIIKSIKVAFKILKRIHPDIIFFKGGFVGFPFWMALTFCMKFHGKIYTHESDISPGILTKLVKKRAKIHFESFSKKNPMPLFFVSQNKKLSSHSLSPPLEISSKGTHTKHILVFGGSQGSCFLNEMIFSLHKKLLEKYHITLISGVGKKIKLHHPNFSQYEFISAYNLSQKISTSSLIIARGGANSLFEIIAAKKPSIIIPLPSVARNHQMLNARFFENQNLCAVLPEKNDTIHILPQKIEFVFQDKKMRQSLSQSNIKNSAGIIAEKIIES
jgi:UDP-N-acetylglucosamine--N-acetylmuramyl-(pentapeptide) pyrophosphoryl-undecaprenol N-acetylglucosamine transferase